MGVHWGSEEIHDSLKNIPPLKNGFLLKSVVGKYLKI